MDRCRELIKCRHPHRREARGKFKLGRKVLQCFQTQVNMPIETGTVKTRTKRANRLDLGQAPEPGDRNARPQDSIKSTLPSREHRREAWNCELQCTVILNPNPLMIVQKGRERRRIMNITPEKFKPRGVLKLTQATSICNRGTTDLPHPIKKRPCKTLVTNNGMDVLFELQHRPGAH